MLLPDAENAPDLAARLRAWALRPANYRAAIAPLSASLRSYSWDDMAQRIAALLEED